MAKKLTKALQYIPGVHKIIERQKQRRLPGIQKKLTSELRLIERQEKLLFFVILVPGCLHIAKRSLELVPDNVQVVLILNGVSKFEKEWVTFNFSSYQMVMTKTLVRHHIVINSLLGSQVSNFGILDYDCFVFRPECFEEIAVLSNNTSMQGFFAYRNESLQLEFPETFFLYFNTLFINQLISKYGVTADPVDWPGLPVKVQDKLRFLGLSPKCLPEEHKKNFDTLRVLMALSLVDKVPYKIVRNYDCESRFNGDIVHIGGVSHPNFFQNSWKFIGSYFWRRLLQFEPESSLKNYYRNQYGAMTSDQLLEAHPDYVQLSTKSELENVNLFVSMII